MTYKQLLKWGGARRRLSPTCCRFAPPLLKFQPWLPKTWPGLHWMRAVLFVFCYQNIVTVIVNVVHTPSLHHRLSLWCKLGVRTVTWRMSVSCRSYTLNTNSLSIICIFICAPCFYRIATAIRHFTTDSWCICLIHLCKVVFLNFAPPPCCQSHFNHCL